MSALRVAGSRFFRGTSRRTFASVATLKDTNAYEAAKLDKKMMVGFFNAHFSLPGKMLEPRFEEMAKSYDDSYFFFKADVDDVPIVAYEGEVTDVPAIVVMPLGAKADGTLYETADWTVHQMGDNNFDHVVAAAKGSIDSCGFGSETGKREPWKFDPNSGTSKFPHQM